MQVLNTEKDSVLIGSGYLYAIESSEFVKDPINISDMVEIGYIKDSAKFTRTHEQKDIESANYGTIDSINGKYTTTFDTGIISYNANNVARFLTGDRIVAAADNQGGSTKTTFYAESSKTPSVALVFVGDDTDENDVGAKFTLVMPKCKWQGEYALDFNNDNPVELNYSFKCLNTTMPNNQIGAAWLIEERKTTVQSGG